MNSFHAERLPLAGTVQDPAVRELRERDSAVDRMRMRIYSAIAGAILVTALLALLK